MTTTSPKPYVFVIMPFSPEFDDVYELGIKPACDEAGAYAERVDEQLFAESILDRIYNQLSKADVIVADMTGRNPNVFYEAGYAHALGRKVILLTQKTEDIPFDLKHYPHIVYGGRIADLIPELKKWVEWAITQPLNKKKVREVSFFIGGNPLSDQTEIDCKVPHGAMIKNFDLKIDMNNSTEMHIKKALFQIGFLTDEDIWDITYFVGADTFSISNIKQPDGKLLYLMDGVFELRPGGWDSIDLQFSKRETINDGDIFGATIRVFSEVAPEDFPFLIKFKSFGDPKELAKKMRS